MLSLASRSRPRTGAYFRVVGQVNCVQESPEAPDDEPAVPKIENLRSSSLLPHLWQARSGSEPILTRASVTSPHSRQRYS